MGEKSNIDEIIYKEDETGKRINIIMIISMLGALATIIAVVLQFFDFKFPIKSNPNVYIEDENIDITYLQKLRNDEENSFYPLFQDKIDVHSKNEFVSNCATQVHITNNYDETITLKKIVFEAKNIEEDLKPILRINQCVFEDKIQLRIENIGWQDAENIVITFEDENINEYLSKDRQTKEIPLIKYGSSISIPLWECKDFIKEGYFNIKLKVTGKNGDIETRYTENRNGIELELQNGEFIIPFGSGGQSDLVYGIKVNTETNSYKEEEIISENINPHDRLELPICFSAEKTCTFDFRIGFTILTHNNKEKMVWSDYANFKIEVSSVDIATENAKDYSKSELLENIYGFYGGIVSYPYVDKDEFKY